MKNSGTQGEQRIPFKPASNSVVAGASSKPPGPISVNPFQREGEVPSALKEAADNMIRLGESLNEWRQRRLDDLRQLAERFRDESERIARKADSSIRAIVGNFNVPLFKHLLGVHKYSDPGAASLCTGAPIVGSFDGPDEWPVVDDAPRGWSQAEILQADEEQRNSFGGRSTTRSGGTLR